MKALRTISFEIRILEVDARIFLHSSGQVCIRRLSFVSNWMRVKSLEGIEKAFEGILFKALSEHFTKKRNSAGGEGHEE